MKARRLNKPAAGKPLLLLMTAVILSACFGSSPVTRMYALRTDSVGSEGAAITIGVGPMELPDYLKQPVTVNRRIVGRVSPENITEAIEWARSLKESNVIEEFSLGPATLEDIYIRLVKNPNDVERPGEVT